MTEYPLSLADRIVSCMRHDTKRSGPAFMATHGKIGIYRAGINSILSITRKIVAILTRGVLLLLAFAVSKRMILTRHNGNLDGHVGSIITTYGELSLSHEIGRTFR